MPVTWRLDGPVLVVETIGQYTRAELESALDEALAAPAFTPGTPALFDSRRSDADVTRDDIEWRAAWLESLHRRGLARRAAVLVPSAPHRYGMARMLQAHLEHRGFRFNIFSDYVEAVRWLAGERQGQPES